MPDLTTQLITGRWTYVVADGFGLIDGDREPDEVGPTGQVFFTPEIGGNASLPAGSPIRSVALGLHRGLIVDGELQDLNGLPGIRLPIKIGPHPIYWTAQPALKWRDTKIAATPIRFGPSADTTTEIRLNEVVDPATYPALGDAIIRQIVAEWLEDLGDERFATVASLTGKADLIGGKLNPAQLPERAVIRYLGPVSSEAAMLALTGQEGDWCLRTDTGIHWVITGSDPSQISSWEDVQLPPSALTKPAADALYARTWQPNETLTAGAVRVLPSPTNGLGTRVANGTTRSAYDTTEQAAWATSSGYDGGTEY